MGHEAQNDWEGELGEQPQTQEIVPGTEKPEIEKIGNIINTPLPEDEEDEDEKSQRILLTVTLPRLPTISLCGPQELLARL